ncbi:MAG: GNAT family N-acetyltransferase [Phycisphaeraceae bacterium]|nr:GNAT family N-acetyltransferase [Phycisphaeraceae bacterium]MCW5753905.1 GNAT family N-acetyltransferase [Phycisphaeraceae bacterium]
MADQVCATPKDIERGLFGESDGRGFAEALVASLDGLPQGFALYFHNFSTFLGKPGIWLEDLFVRPEARGYGVGKALLKRLAEIGVERGCQRLEWAVLDWNEPAIGFYKRLGATVLEEWRICRLSGHALATFVREPGSRIE